MSAKTAVATVDNGFYAKLEHARFGLTTIGMTLQSCLSAVAVNYLLQLDNDRDLIPLILIAMITMASNAFIIAQMSMKLIFNTFVLSIISATAFLIYALLSV
ncbi:hypothetical protein SAMN05216474_0582 [Lishizhenia tianjinensis]|uniref:Uncharacterized protein n=1 Tax=Lishizhenia tianjinensis TaxID=477690 RepID=A0A1I6Y0A0_9FLAO|nr:hypothetical protein [Lishizhenia tianjinensis]SFT44039.1 hypothetical protein SAMN05216474_0582 [Lishizhenia tianjinensis]